MKAIPVILITGYLGAGKTSLLKRILAFPTIAAKHPALIINEFGAVNIDGASLSDELYDIYKLNKGSLFCVCLQADVQRAFAEISQGGRAEVVLVEATGIADPSDLSAMLQVPALARDFRIQANVCLVDALNFSKVAPYMQAAQHQIIEADALALNKIDLVAEEDIAQIEGALRKLNTHAPLVHCRHGNIPESFLAGIEHRSLTGPPQSAPPFGIIAVTLDLASPLDRDAFLRALTDLGETLLRAKGYIDFGDGPGLVEMVFGRSSVQPVDSTPRGGNAFTLIVQGIRRDEIMTRFAPFLRQG